MAGRFFFQESAPPWGVTKPRYGLKKKPDGVCLGSKAETGGVSLPVTLPLYVRPKGTHWPANGSPQGYILQSSSFL